MHAGADQLRAQPDRSGIFLDFDGTLSHIVDVPSDARPLDGARDLLAELGRRYAAAAIVSGRGAGELLEWFGSEVEIWGVHGAERTSNGEVVLSERALPFLESMARARRELEEAVAQLDLRGVIVEDKRIMIGLHYRTAADPERASGELERLAAEAARRYGAEVTTGKMAYELRPPVEFSKAQVVLERAEALGLECAAFGGDDVVDLPGYEALDLLDERGLAT
ncbi:MAG: trehalose-phosphatase, partial [Actinomycetota bacterium]